MRKKSMCGSRPLCIGRRITALLLLALSLSAPLVAQISLSVKLQTIKSVLQEIQKKNAYNFFYNEGVVGLDKVVTLNVDDQSIEQTLNLLFSDTDLSYKIDGKMIVITLKDRLKSKSAVRKISGTVYDEKGESLIGATVMVKGTQTGTVTDIDGRFSLEAPTNGQLLISYIGYAAKTIHINGQQTFKVTIAEDAKALDEVVVIGYGAVRKKDLTGAIGAVKGEELAAKKTTMLSNALQGTVSGLMVRRDNSAPGASAGSMHIRGVTTIGDSNPLIIVDGVPGSLDYVNPNDVESISVLKDAASASIYGSRAAAGVILVTTKRAAQADLQLSLNAEYGVEIPTVQPEMVGATRYLEMSNELRYNDNPAGGFFQTYSADQVKNWVNRNATDPNNYPLTDWRDLILRPSAPRQSYSLSISGGNKSVRTKATLSYDRTDGLYGDRNFERFMVRINNDFTINKMLGAKVDINVRNAMNHTPIYSPFASMRMTPAIYAAMWNDGRIAEGKSGGNPYGLLQMGGNKDAYSTQVGGKASLDFTPFKGFTVSANVSPFLNFSKAKEFKKKAFYTLANDPNAFGGWLEDNANPYSTNKLTETRNDEFNLTTQVVANYMKSFGEHNLTVMAGYESYLANTENLAASRDQYILTQYPYLSIGPEDFRDNSGSGTVYSSNSFFGRVMYSFNNRYLLQANIRHDGSSRFSSQYRWGTFPSVSAGWVISEENFFKQADMDWFSFLKLRASWGSLGNERIGDFPFMALMTFGDALFYGEDGLLSDKTAAQKKFAVQNITWETTTSTDFGIDLAFFNNRLRLTADYYMKQTRDMLLNTKIPSFMGYENPDTNAGRMSTNGVDFELGWNDRKGDWNYGVAVNFSDFISKIDYLENTKTISSNKIKVAGVGFNEWYGYICEGIYQTQEDVNNSAKLNNQVQRGDLKYRDISGPNGVPDGIISEEYDRVPLGNSLPRFQYGGNVNVGYKGFSLSIAFQGIGSQQVRLAREMIEPLRGNYGNIPAIYDGNYWSLFNTDQENASMKYPRLTRANVDSNMAMSDYWLFDGSYFRLKNVTFGYTLPAKLTEKALMKKVHIFASASDLFCLSNFPKGWDPEMGVSSYPITTSILLGLSITF